MSIYNHSYYIYAYLRQDGSPYYIGMGKGRRAWERKAHNRHNIAVPPDRERIVIMENNLTQIGAVALERFYIRWYGKKTEGGILRNVADGGATGCSGYKFSEEQLRKRGETISKGKIGKKTGPQSPELIAKRAKAISLAQIGKKRPRKICPVCGANLDPMNYAKHGHGENCKRINNE